MRIAVIAGADYMLGVIYGFLAFGAPIVVGVMIWQPGMLRLLQSLPLTNWDTSTKRHHYWIAILHEARIIQRRAPLSRKVKTFSYVVGTVLLGTLYVAGVLNSGRFVASPLPIMISLTIFWALVFQRWLSDSISFALQIEEGRSQYVKAAVSTDSHLFAGMGLATREAILTPQLVSILAALPLYRLTYETNTSEVIGLLGGTLLGVMIGRWLFLSFSRRVFMQASLLGRLLKLWKIPSIAPDSDIFSLSSLDPSRIWRREVVQFIAQFDRDLISVCRELGGPGHPIVSSLFTLRQKLKGNLAGIDSLSRSMPAETKLLLDDLAIIILGAKNEDFFARLTARLGGQEQGYIAPSWRVRLRAAGASIATLDAAGRTIVYWLIGLGIAWVGFKGHTFKPMIEWFK